MVLTSEETSIAWKVSKYRFSCIWTEYGDLRSKSEKYGKLNKGKYGPGIIPYLDTFHAVKHWINMNMPCLKDALKAYFW